MSEAVAFGLLVMVLWGTADFVQTIPIRTIGAARTMVVRAAFTLLVGTVTALVLWRTDTLVLTVTTVVVVTASSAIYAAGYYAYMRGFEVGRVAIVAPIASSFAIVTVGLGVVIGGEALSVPRMVAIAVVISGLFLTTTDLREWFAPAAVRVPSSGLGFAFATLILFGIAFFVLGTVGGASAASLFAVSSVTRGLAFMGLGLAAGGHPVKADLPASILIAFVAHAALLHGGWLAYIIGTGRTEVSVIAPIVSVFAGVTVLLAVLVNRERLAANQWLGVAIVLAGIFLLSS